MRLELGHRLDQYLDNVVFWTVVSNQYEEIYDLAHHAKKKGKPVTLPLEF